MIKSKQSDISGLRSTPRLFRRGSTPWLYCVGVVAGAVGGAVNNLVTVFLAAFVYDLPGFARAYLLLGWIGAVPLGAAIGAGATSTAIWLRSIATNAVWGERTEAVVFSVGAFVGTALTYYFISLAVFGGLPIWWVAAIISLIAGLAAYGVAMLANAKSRAS